MWMGTNVFHSRAACANLSSQDVVKYLGNILFALLKKGKIYLQQEKHEQNTVYDNLHLKWK